MTDDESKFQVIAQKEDRVDWFHVTASIPMRICVPAGMHAKTPTPPHPCVHLHPQRAIRPSTMSNSQSTTSLFHTGSRGVKRKRGKVRSLDPVKKTCLISL